VPFKIVLRNDQVERMVVDKKTTKALMESGVLIELREELWEVNDTTQVF